MTLVIQAHLECDLLHTQETRLQQVLGALHAQQSQITDRRHAHIGLEDVTESPDRKVYGLREVGKRQFTANAFAHHLCDFFSSFIQADTLGRCLYSRLLMMMTTGIRRPNSSLLRLNSGEVSGLGGLTPWGKTESGK